MYKSRKKCENLCKNQKIQNICKQLPGLIQTDVGTIDSQVTYDAK